MLGCFKDTTSFSSYTTYIDTEKDLGLSPFIKVAFEARWKATEETVCCTTVWQAMWCANKCTEIKEFM